MALSIPPDLDIAPYGCHWDPVNPHGCFDETSCGCYLSPCDYFKVPDADCELDTSDLCCALVETC